MVLTRPSFGEQGLPETPLLLPIQLRSHPLKLTHVDRVVAPHGRRQKEYGFLQIRTGHALIMSRRPRCACAIVTIPFLIAKRRLYAVVQTSRRTAF